MPPDTLAYLSGFRNHLASEALPGALPAALAEPRAHSMGLVPEQLHGTSPRAPRGEALHLWVYRLRPSVVHAPWSRVAAPRLTATPPEGSPPEQLRFRPLAMPTGVVDFAEGLTTFAAAGGPGGGGAAIHTYAINASMQTRSLANLDGHLLFLPEAGPLLLQTEAGRLRVGPGEVAVIPQGMRFAVHVEGRGARGFVAESMAGPFELSERGPAGFNALADARHVQLPVAAFEDRGGSYTLLVKSGGHLYESPAAYSPFDIVAWQGNYLPFKYDLQRFSPLGSLGGEQADPTLLSVMSAALPGAPGRSALELIVFPGRWDVAEEALRGQGFRRSAGASFSAVLLAPEERAGSPRGTFTFTPAHVTRGPSARRYNASVALNDRDASKPRRLPSHTLWVQVDSDLPLQVTPWMLAHPQRDHELLKTLQGYRPAQVGRQGSK